MAELRIPFDQYSWPRRTDMIPFPFDHQIETVGFMLNNPRAFLLLDMGCGKTLSVLWFFDFLYANGLVDKIVIVAPLSTLYAVWKSELDTHLPHLRYEIVHGGSRQSKVAALSRKAQVYIINTDGVKSMENELSMIKPDIWAFDELTNFKNLSAERTKAAIRLTKNSRSVYGLTGEPTPNGPLEAYGQAKLVNPTNPYLPKYFTQYRDMVCIPLDIVTWVPRPAAEVAPIVFYALQPAIRKTIEECMDMPDMIKEYRFIEMGAEQKAVYKSMKDSGIHVEGEREIKGVNAATKLLKLLQISSGIVKDSEQVPVYFENQPHLDEYMTIWQEVHREPIVIACWFIASMHQIRDFLTSQGLRGTCIYGDIKSKMRGEMVYDFQHGEYDFIILQPQAAAHGITLTASSTVIWHGPIYSAELYHQLLKRIRRPGQKKKQRMIHIARSAADNRMYKALEAKENMSDITLELFELAGKEP